MTRDEAKQALCAFLDTISEKDTPAIETDENLPFEETGLVDSLSMLEIVSFLEERFSVDFSEIGIDAENLGSIARILALIESQAP